MRRFKDENLKKQTNKLEKQLSKRLGGLKQPVSGALNNKKLKGDIRIGKLKGDVKMTSKKSFTITQDMLQKISNECYLDEYPFLYIVFTNAPKVFREWAIISGDLFNEFKKWFNSR